MNDCCCRCGFAKLEIGLDSTGEVIWNFPTLSWSPNRSRNNSRHHNHCVTSARYFGIAPDLKDKVLELELCPSFMAQWQGRFSMIRTGQTLSPAFWAFLYSIAVPFLVGIILVYIVAYRVTYGAAQLIRLPLAHHIPTAWDYTFSALPSGAFILVTLSDETSIPGRMSKNSFASSSGDERDILIEELWKIGRGGAWT